LRREFGLKELAPIALARSALGIPRSANVARGFQVASIIGFAVFLRQRVPTADDDR